MSELPPQFIELRTPRFLLRTLQPGDAGPALEAWTLDPIIAEMMNAEMKTWAVERQRSLFTEGLVRQDRRIIGIFPLGSTAPIGLYILKLNAAKRSFVVSSLVGDSNWRGKGVPAECGEAIYHLLFVECGFHKARANVLPANKAMIWLMAHSAWKREGTLRKQLRNPATGERMDVHVYGLLKPLWQEFTARGEKTPGGATV